MSDDPVSALAAALSPDFAVLDHEDFLEIVDSDRCTIALALAEPPAVEIELSCVFTQGMEDDDELQAMAYESDGLMRAIVEQHWAPKGFKAAEIGEIRESELVEDETQYILSYDLPLIAKAENIEALAELIRWAARQDSDFIV